MKINPPQMMLFLLPKPMIKINKMKNTRIVIKIKLWATIKGELRKMKMRMIKKSQYPQLLGLRRCANTFAANSDLQHHVPDFYHGACGQRMANALLDGLLAGRLLHCHACSKPGGGGRSVLSQDTPCQRGPPERQVDSQHLRCAIDPSFMPIRVHMVASLRCHASTADPDKFVWTWSANQQYSTSSDVHSILLGPVQCAGLQGASQNSYDAELQVLRVARIVGAVLDVGEASMPQHAEQ
jgi:hypothetical protein